MIDNLYCVEKNISLYDLMQNLQANRAIKEQDTKALESILYSIGFDVALGWSFTESIEHRPRSMKNNSTWFGPMIEGFELSTKEWLSSGWASEEAIIGYCRDPHLRSELIVLSRQANHTGNLIDDMKKQSKYNEWKEEK